MKKIWFFKLILYTLINIKYVSETLETHYEANEARKWKINLIKSLIWNKIGFFIQFFQFFKTLFCRKVIGKVISQKLIDALEKKYF